MDDSVQLDGRAQHLDVCTSLRNMNYLITSHDEAGITKASFPSGHTFNGIELYKEILIANNTVQLSFGGKIIDLKKVMGFDGQLSNSTDFHMLFQTIKNLVPCRGYTFEKPDGTFNIWNRIGRNEEGDGRESINCKNCIRLLPTNCLDTTEVCIPCQRSKRYHVDRQNELDTTKSQIDDTVVLEDDRDDLTKISTEIKDFSVLNDEQEISISSQIERPETADPCTNRWDRQY